MADTLEFKKNMVKLYWFQGITEHMLNKHGKSQHRLKHNFAASILPFGERFARDVQRVTSKMGKVTWIESAFWRLGFFQCVSRYIYQGTIGCTPGPAYPYGKSLYKPYIVGIYGFKSQTFDNQSF